MGSARSRRDKRGKRGETAPIPSPLCGEASVLRILEDCPCEEVAP